MPREQSSRLHELAKHVIPGGLNSPVQAVETGGGRTPYIVPGKDARVRDADGRQNIDCVSSCGPPILGHAQPQAAKTANRAGAAFAQL
ncbi:MAG: hypothetical protein GXP31_08805 [Kiritimatiellaeota bacterium]|nr:hypothetical protein [Kiritimatiellota bacterium]